MKVGELGCAVAYHNLRCSYDTGTGVDIDKKKGMHYLEIAAMNGVSARYYLGCSKRRTYVLVIDYMNYISLLLYYYPLTFINVQL